MVCARVRRIGRVFTVILLVWTGVDLVDHNLCGHDAAAADGRVAAFVAPSSPAGHTDVPRADHSFCCSHSVDVQARFHLDVIVRTVCLPRVSAGASPPTLPGGLYHPPLSES
jgi:hypothetical protein